MVGKKKENGEKRHLPSGNIPFPEIIIQNIVVSADLHATVDLYALSKEVKSIDYEPEQFPGAIYKIHNPKTALLLFKNGKVICTGSKTEADIHRAIDIMIKTVQKYILVPQTDEDEKK